MKISISSVSPVADKDADAVWENCPSATYFHSREWAEIWQTYHHGESFSVPQMVLFSDGKKALLPFSVQRIAKGLGQRVVSSACGTYGGWISNDSLTEEHARLLVEYVFNKYDNIYWRINPYDELTSLPGIKPTREDQTHVLDLLGGFEAVYKGWTKGHRSATTKARHCGVSVKIASSPEDWDAYYGIYQDSLRRWGKRASSNYGKELFLDMFRRNSPHIKLWLGMYENKPVAGCLCFYALKHVVYWHGAALEKYFYLRPVNLVLYEVIKDACDKGYAWFDFNPSGGHEGVKSFKESFGCQVKPCGAYVRETWIVKGHSMASLWTWRILKLLGKK